MSKPISNKQIEFINNHPVAYLGAPYNHSEIAVRRFRHNLVNFYTNKLLNEGRLVYSPLTHNIPMHELGIEQTWQQWERFDKAMLSRCNSLIVLQADGWKESVGLSAEIEFAKEMNIAIEYLMPDLCLSSSSAA